MNTTPQNHSEVKLGKILRGLTIQHNTTLTKLTVMSDSNDPFRLDTPTHHVNGKWLLDQMQACGLMDGDKKIHNRGIHYTLVSKGGILLPDGRPYKNDDECWAFLEDKASKAARWLGYVPFSKIFDKRSTNVTVRIREEIERDEPFAGVNGVAQDIKERLAATRFTAYVHADFTPPPQPYHIVMWGEKNSLEDVLDPIAERYNTDLYLGAGEISDSNIYKMADSSVQDGRPVIVAVLADCDPSGYQMAVSIGHKLRALKEGFFPEFEFDVITPCLTVDQVKDLGLPSTPLKETEKRAAGWKRRYGVEQTEIDALATLHPDVLRPIVEDAISEYYDKTLEDRVDAARRDWHERATNHLSNALELSDFGEARDRAMRQLEDVRAVLDRIDDDLDDIVDELHLDFPLVEIPQPEVYPLGLNTLVSSSDSLMDAIEILRARKNYKE